MFGVVESFPDNRYSDTVSEEFDSSYSEGGGSGSRFEFLGLVASFLAVTALLFPISSPIFLGIYIPNMPMILLVVLLGFKAPERVVTVALFFCVTVLFCIFNVLSTSYYFVVLTEKMKSAVLLVFYVTSFTVIVAAGPWIRQQRRTIGMVCFGFSAMWLVLAGLETWLPVVKEVSDDFRMMAYHEDVVYSAENRDYSIVGRERPNAFMSEPARASFAVGALAFLGIAAFRTRAALVLAGALALCGGVIIGSPVSLIFLAFIVYFYSVHIGSIFSVRLLRGGVSVCLLVALASVVYLTISSVQNRVEMIESGNENSAYARTVFQWELAWEGFLHNPLSGVGLGGEEELSHFLSMRPEMVQKESNRMIQGPFWSMILFCGFSGLSFFVFIFYMLYRIFGGFPFVVICEAFFILFQQFGSIQATTVWILMGLMLALWETQRVGRGRVPSFGEMVDGLNEGRSGGVVPRRGL